MTETLNNLSGSPPNEPGASLHARVFRTMAVTVALVVAFSLALASWHVTTGLLLGGTLSLLNYHWMRTSIAAVFESALGAGTAPRLTIANYILRYFVVSLAVFVAYFLNVVSLPAAIAGLCSFVPALFVEASREFYFVIIHREETS